MNIIKNYIGYIKDNPQKLWFKRKLYGWGWTPATKEGWAVILIYILAVVAFACALDNDSSVREIFFTFIIPFVFLTFALIRICYKKGESPKWMWGTESKRYFSEENQNKTPQI